MATLVTFVIEDPNRPGRDVLGSGLDQRGHFIHEVMARAVEPMSLREISEQAKQLADAEGYRYRTEKSAFSTTGEHVRQYLRDKMGYAEQLPDKRWRLTERARERIAAVRGSNMQNTSSPAPPDVRTVDAKSRVLLPAEFANATVTIERVSETEVRIRKAVVIAEDALPLMEDHLKPLSDRDRDLFLSLLDNPPEPVPALQKALKLHRKRHG
jgi:uncharacterized protein (DUF1778 family)